jgi:hypothetical protein
VNRFASEDGDTLVELLIAITVLGLAGVALMGGFGTVIGASAEYRSLATIDSNLKNFAESAINQIQLQSTAIFSPCATASGQTSSTANTEKYNGTLLTYQPPAGYTIQITSIQYLYNNTTFAPSSGSTVCDPTQYWPQLITANATGPKGTNVNLSFVVDDPQYETYVQPSATTTTVPSTTTTTVPSTTTTTTTVPTTTTTAVPAPTITFPTNANPYNAGHNQGLETLHITGTNLQNVSSVTVSGAFSGVTIVSDTATTITITLTGSGGSGALGNLTVTTPGGSVTTSGSLINSGTYNG